MNKRQVIILWVIAILLGVAVALVKVNQRQAADSATHRSPGDTLFESFPANEVATVRVEGAGESATLVKKGDGWAVAERDEFPANTTFVTGLLRTLDELKVTQGMEAGPSFAPRFGMDPASSDPETRGLTVRFKDSAGQDLATVSIGKNIESAAAASPMMGGGTVGRFVRNHADESGFYAVSEMFPSLSAEPARWLSQDFISLEKIKTISVTQPGSEDLAWKITREDEDGEFALAESGPGEALDTAATSPLKNLLSYARFEDVIPAAKTEERLIADKTAVATIETFEGFTYTLRITPTQPAGESADEDALPAGDTLALTVAVEAELPKERKAEEGESEEDAKTKDEAFTSRLKTLTEKLEKEKALEGRTFEVSQSTFEPLLKERGDLLQKEDPAAQTGAPQPPPGIAMPPPGTRSSVTTPPVQAFTPPISIPPLEEEPEVPAVETEAPAEETEAPAEEAEAPAEEAAPIEESAPPAESEAAEMTEGEPSEPLQDAVEEPASE